MQENRTLEKGPISLEITRIEITPRCLGEYKPQELLYKLHIIN